jgi:hypothetical protein
VRRWLACLVAAAVLAGCGGGDDGGGESGQTDRPAERSGAVTKSPSAERILRDAADAFRKGRADMLASLQTDLRQNDTKTLIDDLWDLRNVIYEFDQALRRIEFAPGRPERLSVELLEINRGAIARIDPILDAKKPPPGLGEAVEQAATDAEAIERRTTQLLGPGAS